MAEMIILTLVLLQIKHWYIDFVNQDNEEVSHKGMYLHWIGVKHSLKQGIGTYIAISLIVTPVYWQFALFCALLDFVVHYHIDWIKMNYGNRDITTPAFWNHLGLDQMAHQLTYLFIAYMMT